MTLQTNLAQFDTKDTGNKEKANKLDFMKTKKFLYIKRHYQQSTKATE